jgi:hypothetical protein
MSALPLGEIAMQVEYVHSQWQIGEIDTGLAIGLLQSLVCACSSLNTTSNCVQNNADQHALRKIYQTTNTFCETWRAHFHEEMMEKDRIEEVRRMSHHGLCTIL